MKRKKLISFGILAIAIAFYTPLIVRNLNYRKEYCCRSFKGTVKEINFDIKEYITVLLADGNSYYLSKYFIYRNENLSVGDSIVKNKGSYNIYVYKDQKLKFVADSYDKHTCKCE